MPRWHDIYQLSTVKVKLNYLSLMRLEGLIQINRSYALLNCLRYLTTEIYIYRFYYICLFNGTLTNAYSYSFACSRQCYSLYSLFFIIYCIFFKSFLLKFDFFLKIWSISKISKFHQFLKYQTYLKYLLK